MAIKQVKLMVISDILCPWCYIGQRELIDAMDEVSKSNSNISFELEYRPFCINPSIKDDEPWDKMPYYLTKWSKDQIQSMYARITQRAKECNIVCNPFASPLLYSTRRSHRLLYKAWNVGRQETQQNLLDALFKAYFERGLDISNKDLLADLANEAGVMTKEEALEYLDSDEDVETVEDMIEQARSGGVTGVPFMVICGKWVISGGQSKDIYLQIFKKLANRSTCSRSPSPGTVATDETATCIANGTEVNSACMVRSA